MRVLVTGAAGFVGRACVLLLAERGHEVHAVSRRTPEGAPEVRWHATDLLAPGEAERLVAAVRPEALLHLAWYTEHGRFWDAMENYAWVGASLSLFRAFAEGGGRRVVGAGTCAEYDWSAGECDEASTPAHPATPYGACKLATGQLLLSLAARTGTSAAWGRLFFVYGPGEDPRRLVPSVARALLSGEPAECTSGEQMRDFLHVRDVARAYVALLESGVEGVVNVASGEPASVRAVVEGIARRTGGAGLVRLGTRRPAPGEPPVIAAATRRLREEVGWSPELTLEAGLDDAVGWWRRRMAGEEAQR